MLRKTNLQNDLREHYDSNHAYPEKINRLRIKIRGLDYINEVIETYVVPLRF